MIEVNGPSVGFLDDDLDFLGSLMEHETVRQISMKTTGEATESLDWVKQGRIDILVADLRMPVDAGLDILEQAQKLGNITGILLTAFELTDAEQARRQKLGVMIYRKSELSDLLDYLEGLRKDLESPLDPLEMRKLRYEVEELRKINEEWIADLVSMLSRIPEMEKAFISSSEGPFTVAQLIDDIRQFRPRGREYIRLWRQTVGTLLKLGKKL